LLIVRRLSRPTLALQNALPNETNKALSISPSASLAFPSPNQIDNAFILSQNVSLPPSFGSAYVGETFLCSLCANNELPPNQTPLTKAISNIKILAEMQTPSSSIPLTLHPPPPSPPQQPATSPPTLQHIISFSLKEEGTHVLACSITYTETTLTPSPSFDSSAAPIPTSSRTRSFRKLYQFPTVPCLSVRTKATELPALSVPDKSGGPYGRMPLLRYTLEAQLENVSDGTIVLESAVLHAKPPFGAVGLNWDFAELSRGNGGEEEEEDDDEKMGADAQRPILAPRDVHQLSYLLTQQQSVADGLEELKAMLKRDGRAVLGQLSIEWRGGMGEKGSLTTGNLLTRRKL
jgi:trafficking protein particle complex subunit 13